MSRLDFTAPSPKLSIDSAQECNETSVWTRLDQEIRTSGDAGLTLSQFYRLVSSGTFHPRSK